MVSNRKKNLITLKRERQLEWKNIIQFNLKEALAQSIEQTKSAFIFIIVMLLLQQEFINMNQFNSQFATIQNNST